MVATENVSYKFTLYTTNDIPKKSKAYVTFPTSWKLDCSKLPTVKCDLNCEFLNIGVSCDSTTNSL